jgi:hypothetical protein
MDSIDQIVFDLTPLGKTALKDESTSLAANLRALLLMVDGVCPVAQYGPFLRALAPIEEKFIVLESLGYIQRIGSVSSVAVSSFQATLQAGLGVNTLPRIDRESPGSNFAPLY